MKEKLEKAEIVTALKQKHNHFLDVLSSLNEEQIVYAPEGKWTALQQLDHLCSSVNAVNLVFKLPTFIVKWRFGKANRPSKTYPQLVEKYQLKLADSGRAPARFQPKWIGKSEKEALIQKLQTVLNTMCKGVEKMSESNLDTLILPHPLMGRITLREMLYFTIYHAEHHENLVKKYLDL